MGTAGQVLVLHLLLMPRDMFNARLLGLGSPDIPRPAGKARREECTLIRDKTIALARNFCRPGEQWLQTYAHTGCFLGERGMVDTVK
ncbi:hypothetical protein RRG08_031087 [Elysia crispata]|uniref:Uncharacterized protein n=1 Tax=Elysia crispata TaxID=231223 RepID=A0AAE0ZFL7_9GAST|nr:hypothetical protein RRG08_031087 [Elysia crispata]